MSEAVVLDARKVGDGGIGVYLDNLISGLSELKDSNELNANIHLIIPPLSLLSERCIPIVHRWAKTCDCVEEKAGKYSFSEHFILPQHHRTLLRSASIYHSPHITLPFGLPIPSVATVHDTLLLTHSPSFSKKMIAMKIISSTMRRASATLTVSSQSKKYLEKLSAEKKLPIQLVHNAVATRYTSSKKACEVKPNRILWIGNEKPHKGLKLFIETLECFAPTWGVEPYQVTVVCPKLSKESASALKALGAQVFSDIDDQTLRELYFESRVVVMSSYEEGCGLPAIEAAALGVPIVSTPLPSVEEMCAEVPYYSKDFTAASLTNTLYQALNDEYYIQSERLELGKRKMAAFSPRNQARRVAQVYDLVLAQGGKESFFLNPSADILEPSKRSVG